jgi:hypothetical protein
MPVKNLSCTFCFSGFGKMLTVGCRMRKSILKTLDEEELFSYFRTINESF